MDVYIKKAKFFKKINKKQEVFIKKLHKKEMLKVYIV